MRWIVLMILVVLGVWQLCQIDCRTPFDAAREPDEIDHIADELEQTNDVPRCVRLLRNKAHTLRQRLEVN